MKFSEIFCDVAQYWPEKISLGERIIENGKIYFPMLRKFFQTVEDIILEETGDNLELLMNISIISVLEKDLEFKEKREIILSDIDFKIIEEEFLKNLYDERFKNQYSDAEYLNIIDNYKRDIPTKKKLFKGSKNPVEWYVYDKKEGKKGVDRSGKKVGN